MMMRFTIYLLWMLLFPMSGADTPVIAIGVRDVTTTIGDASDPEYLILFVRFDAILRNRTSVDLHLAPEPVFLTQVDRFRGPQGWEVMLTSSWYDTGDVKYKTCRLVRPGETFDFPHVQTNATLKKVDKEARSRVVVRFHLQAACKEGAKTFIQPLVTGPVELKMPRW